MDDDLIRQIRYSENFSEYAPFFDYEWVEGFLQRGDSAGVSRSTEQLVLMWKGASLVRSMSWLMINSISDTISNNAYLNEPLSIQIVTAMSEKITKQSNLGGIFLDGPTRAGLVREIKNVESEVRSNLEKCELRQDPAETWVKYLEIQDFGLAVWHAELGVFSQLYFAFENFLVQALEEKLGIEGVRADCLKRHMLEHFDEALFNRMWGDRPIAFARLVRHAITHNGAYITPKLEGYKDWLVLDDRGGISILPEQTETLYRDLIGRAEELVLRISELEANGVTPS